MIHMQYNNTHKLPQGDFIPVQLNIKVEINTFAERFDENPERLMEAPMQWNELTRAERMIEEYVIADEMKEIEDEYINEVI